MDTKSYPAALLSLHLAIHKHIWRLALRVVSYLSDRSWADLCRPRPHHQTPSPSGPICPSTGCLWTTMPAHHKTQLIQYNATTPCNMCNTVNYNTIQYSTIQLSAVLTLKWRCHFQLFLILDFYNLPAFRVPRFSTWQYNTTQYNTIHSLLCMGLQCK